MKLTDLSDLNKEDILSALGLSSKRSTSDRVLSSLGVFGAGLLIGAGAALLLAPQSGIGLRGDLSERLRKARNGEAEAPEPADGTSSRDEART